MLLVSLSSCVTANVKPVPTQTYTITYHLDGGMNHPDNPATYTNKDETITFIVASKDGFIFDGWHLDANFSNPVVVLMGGSSGNLHLYAKWISESATIITLIFDSRGGSDVSAIAQPAGTQLNPPSEPQRSGYDFEGWFEDNYTFLILYVFETMPSENKTLYAKWIPLQSGIGYVCPTFGEAGECPTISMNYYASIAGLYGASLKDELHEIIDDGLANIGTYTATTAKLMIVDEDPDNSNNVLEHYSRVSMPKANYSGYGQSSYDWDKEHVWAKSRGDFANLKAGADIMNLRPAFGSTNSARGNRDYNDQTPTSTPRIVTLEGQPVLSGYMNSDGSFAPTDQAKGDVARILLYMVVMYNGDVESQGLNLELNDLIVTVNTYKGAFHGKISILMQWHLQDPVDESEIRRNGKVQAIQGNRNPFVDYPHFAELIWPEYYA